VSRDIVPKVAAPNNNCVQWEERRSAHVPNGLPMLNYVIILQETQMGTFMEDETRRKANLVLFKFGEKAHLEDFRTTGNLYMNTQAYFTGVENDALRHDPFEGYDEIHQPKDIRTFTITNDETGETTVFKSENFAGPIKINFGRQSYSLFCMHGLDTIPNEGADLVDQRNLQFGNSFIVVLNNQEFLNRVGRATSALGIESSWAPVEYYDVETHSGETGPFRKPSAFGFQREFRIAIYPGSTGPVRLPVGDLTDITTPIFSLADINKIVKLQTR
jgi:hypothetical protein